MIFNTSYVLNPHLNTRIVDSASNPIKVDVVGSKVMDYFTQSNFPEGEISDTFVVQDGRGIEVRADTSDVTLTIHNVPMLIKSGETFQANFDTFTDFIVSCTGDFRIWVKE